MKRPTFFAVLLRSEPVRVFQLILGVLLMMFGPIIGLPTPGPLGFILFGFGAALVLRNSAWARRRYVRYSRRYPRVQRAVNFGLRRRSKRRVAVPGNVTEPGLSGSDGAEPRPR